MNELNGRYLVNQSIMSNVSASVSRTGENSLIFGGLITLERGLAMKVTCELLNIFLNICKICIPQLYIIRKIFYEGEAKKWCR